MRSTCKVEQTGIIRHHNSAYFLQICRKNGQIISFSPPVYTIFAAENSWSVCRLRISV